MKFLIVVLMLCICLASCEKTVEPPTDITSLQKFVVWNEAPTNAFTDLINYNGAYYCVFREASSHISYDGRLRVIKSANGINWNSFSLLSLPDKDLRDPHFFYDNNNSLSITANARNKKDQRETVIYKLQNSNFIQSKNINVDNDYWLWSFSRFKDSLYTIGYNTFQPCFNSIESQKPKIALFKNVDPACTSFSNVTVENLINNNFHCPNEASIVFTPDSNLIAIVRDAPALGKSHFGISKFPFKNWTWKEFPYYVRGPKLALLPDGNLFLCAGSMIDVDKTYYAIINPQDFSVEKIKFFPSAGDSGYPGVIIEGSTALVSYYSSYQGNSRVYIVRITY